MAKTYISIFMAYQEQIMKNFGVKSLKLFGSVARNQDKPDSDVNICVEMDPDMFKRSLERTGLQYVSECLFRK